MYDWKGFLLDPSLEYKVGRNTVGQPARAKWGSSATAEDGLGLLIEVSDASRLTDEATVMG